MEWVTFNEALIQADFPTDLKPVYDQWLTAHPEKVERLATIIGHVVAEFRDAIAVNPSNVLDEDEEKIPESCVISAEIKVFYNLMMEMGVSIKEEAQESMTRAELFLRQISYKHFVAKGGEAAAPSPYYGEPVKLPERTLK